MADYVGGRPTNRIQGLDALRTLAIVGVTLFHIFPDVVRGGYLGVSLFFVLTGYLLAYTTERERLSGGFSLGHYLLKRLLRLYPALVVVLFVTLGVYSLMLPETVMDMRAEVTSVALGYNNWWQIAAHADYFTRIANASPFTHLWFMGIELQYAFLLWPLLFLLHTLVSHCLGKGAGIAVIAALGFGTAVLMPLSYQMGADVTRLYYGTDTRVFALLLGAAMGLWRAGASAAKKNPLWREIAEFVSFELLLVAVLFACVFLDGANPLLYRGGMFLVTLLCCLLLAITADRGMTIGKFLDMRVFRWIGTRSYGVFLWQYPVIFLFQQKGWEAMPYFAAWEIAVILLLAMWTEALTKSVGRRELPAFGNCLVHAQGACFLAVTLCGVFLMGFGCRGLAAPAGYKAEARAQLNARLEKNAAELARQKEEAEKAAAAKAAEDKAARMKAADLSGVACIGDSVMLSAAGDLQKALPGCAVDAEVSRYVGGGIEAAQSLAAQGRLGSVVVVSLGTNGPLAAGDRYVEQTQGLLKLLGSSRRIFWVNVYAPHLSWQDPNNEYIRKMAAENKNVTVIDWYGLVSKHPEWLSGDGVHPNDAGTEQYAKLVHDALAEALAK